MACLKVELLYSVLTIHATPLELKLLISLSAVGVVLGCYPAVDKSKQMNFIIPFSDTDANGLEL